MDHSTNHSVSVSEKEKAGGGFPTRLRLTTLEAFAG